MGSMPVVVMYPALEHGGALRGMAVRDAVGPFAKRRLDEALSLAVGLRPVGLGEAVPESQVAAGGREALGAERRAVVGQHALGTYAKGAEVADGVAQELHGARLALV